MNSVAVTVPLLCIYILTACNPKEQQKQAPASSSIKFDRLDPAYTVKARVFNIQPDGSAALAVVGTGLIAGAEVLWNGQPLETGWWRQSRLGWCGGA